MSYELRVERLIDATPEEVFDAYTDPEAMKVWFTILNEGMIVENEIDLRVGGTWVSAWGFSPDESSVRPRSSRSSIGPSAGQQIQRELTGRQRHR